MAGRCIAPRLAVIGNLLGTLLGVRRPGARLQGPGAAGCLVSGCIVCTRPLRGGDLPALGRDSSGVFAVDAALGGLIVVSMLSNEG